MYVNEGHRLGRDTARDLAGIADFVCAHCREPDSGIWEVRARPRHHTQSKAMCWVALDRAMRMANMGRLPAKHAERWSTEAAEIRRFIDEHCWSAKKGSDVWYAGAKELDASLLLMAIMRYDAPDSPRLRGTVDAVRRELASGALLYRYTGDDGLAGREGAFACCSFWLAEALAIAERRKDAGDLMDELLRLANDVGLYAEEMEPRTHEFLGNFPQGLVHLGTAWTDDRSRARVIGSALHFVAGLVFSLVYLCGLSGAGPCRMGARDALWPRARALRGHHAGQRTAACGSSENGDIDQRREFLTTTGTARLHASELRARDSGGHHPRPPRIRGHRGRVHRRRITMTGVRVTTELWARASCDENGALGVAEYSLGDAAKQEALDSA